MLDAALVLGGVLMGAAGLPHCMAMCGAANSALLSRCGGAGPRERAGAADLAFHAARLLGYAGAGALAASGVSALRIFGEAVPALQPLWTLIHVAALALGLWLMVTGRQPAWMSARPRALPAPLAREGWQRVAGPARAGAAGAAWVAWPCGLLQSALIVATLANGALAGALVMTGFAIASAPGLWMAGLLWRRTAAGRALGLVSGAWVVRFSGVFLGLASGWALGAGLWQRVADLCLAG
jgi:sulfite exporter TauE/SafE